MKNIQFMDTVQYHGNIFFSRSMFVSATSPIVLFMYRFYVSVMYYYLTIGHRRRRDYRDIHRA